MSAHPVLVQNRTRNCTPAYNPSGDTVLARPVEECCKNTATPDGDSNLIQFHIFDVSDSSLSGDGIVNRGLTNWALFKLQKIFPAFLRTTRTGSESQVAKTRQLLRQPVRDTTRLQIVAPWGSGEN